MHLIKHCQVKGFSSFDKEIIHTVVYSPERLVAINCDLSMSTRKSTPSTRSLSLLSVMRKRAPRSEMILKYAGIHHTFSPSHNAQCYIYSPFHSLGGSSERFNQT